MKQINNKNDLSNLILDFKEHLPYSIRNSTIRSDFEELKKSNKSLFNNDNPQNHKTFKFYKKISRLY